MEENMLHGENLACRFLNLKYAFCMVILWYDASTH